MRIKGLHVKLELLVNFMQVLHTAAKLITCTAISEGLL